MKTSEKFSLLISLSNFVFLGIVAQSMTCKSDQEKRLYDRQAAYRSSGIDVLQKLEDRLAVLTSDQEQLYDRKSRVELIRLIRGKLVFFVSKPPSGQGLFPIGNKPIEPTAVPQGWNDVVSLLRELEKSMRGNDGSTTYTIPPLIPKVDNFVRDQIRQFYANMDVKLDRLPDLPEPPLANVATENVNIQSLFGRFGVPWMSDGLPSTTKLHPVSGSADVKATKVPGKVGIALKDFLENKS